MKKHTKAFEEHGDFFRGYLNRAVSEISIEGFDNLEKIGKGRVMMVCTHRSHMDYVVGALELSRLGVQNMRFAAGDNLTRIPWFGKKIREMGSFSVFRGKASQRSYLFKLAEQVKRMLLNDDKIVVYPEGGRSYSGRMLEIRTGITGAAVMAQKEQPDVPVYYLPVTMAYDFIPEVPYFKLLLKAKSWRDTSTNGLVRFVGTTLYYAADIWAFFKVGFNPYKDHCRLILGEPIRVTAMADIDAEFNPQGRNAFFANRVAIQKCADQIYTIFLKMHPITASHILGYILDRGDAPSPEAVVTLMEQLSKAGANISSVQGKSGEEILKEGTRLLKRHGAVRQNSRGVRVKDSMTVAYFAGAIKDVFEMNELS